MKNQDKRIKRAKLKAKKARIIKHQNKTLSNRSSREIVTIGGEFIALFESLPNFTSSYDSVPLIRQYYENSRQLSRFHDLEAGVAMIYVMYGHWFSSGSRKIDRKDLQDATDFMLEQPRFKYSMNNKCTVVVDVC